MNAEQKAWEKWHQNANWMAGIKEAFYAGYRVGLKQANPLGRLERLVIKTAIAWLLTDNSYNLRTAISKLQAARKKVKK